MPFQTEKEILVHGFLNQITKKNSLLMQEWFLKKHLQYFFS